MSDFGSENNQWITLRQAARLLGCSARTIRRRFEDGTFATRIEYQGKQMIRLVSRQDVMKAAGKVRVNKLAEKSSGPTPNSLPVTLGGITDNIQRSIVRRIDTLGKRLLIGGVITAGLTAAAIFIFVNRQSKILADKIGGVQVVLSGGMSEMKEELGGTIGELKRVSSEKMDSLRRELSDELRRIEETRETDLAEIRQKADRARTEAREAGSELVLTRMKTAANNSRVAELENKIVDLQASLDSLQENIGRMQNAPPPSPADPPAEINKNETETGRERMESLAVEVNEKTDYPETGTGAEIPGLRKLLLDYRPGKIEFLPGRE